MGTLSLCFVVLLVSYAQLIGRMVADIPGPCQPFKANQTESCSELQTFMSDDGAAKFCNRTTASCGVNDSSKAPPSRKEYFTWGFCYCDEKCKEIGDCCADYDEWHAPRTSAQKLRPKQTCRRRPTHEKRTILGYIMVANCPSSWKDPSTAQKCMSTNYTADPATALPVVDMTENVTYANIYCAMCHGKSRDLHHWSLQLATIKTAFSLKDITSPDTLWKAIPIGHIIPEKCLVTPPEANIGPDTKIKRLCRDYANDILVTEKDGQISVSDGDYKNPHCALLSIPKSDLINETVLCHRKFRFPPRLPYMFFVFSTRAKISRRFGTSTVRLEVNCPIDEIYDPFKGRCLPVHSSIHSNSVNSTEHVQCQGTRFQSNEFLLLNNNSVFIIPHHKAYNKDSYFLMNQTLVLCSNFSRRYTTTVTRAEKDQPLKPPQDHPLTLRVITYVGFALSIISLLVLLVTYFLFAELRTYPGKAVMHLSCAMIVMQSVYFASDPDVVSSAVCSVMGAVLHYSILVVFLWMSAISYNTQKTFSNPNVNPSNPVVMAEQKRAYIRYSVFCWGFPFVAVGICVTLQLTNTGNVGYGYEIHDGCQLSLPARTYAVGIPVTSMILFNVVALIRTAVAIKLHGQGNVAATNERNLPIIVLKLTAVTGITWILGFALAFYPTPYLEYPFIIINSCQGVLICLTFVFKKNVFNLYKQRFMSKIHPEKATSIYELQAGCSKDG